MGKGFNDKRNDNNIEQALDDIREMVKIEKIHENDSYFDKLADDIEIEVRDVLMDKDMISATEDDNMAGFPGRKVFRLTKGQNIAFSFPFPFNIPEKGNIKEFKENIQIKVVPPKKRKLSAKEKERIKQNLMFYKFARTVALAVMLFALGLIGNKIYGYVADSEQDRLIKDIYNVGNVRADVTPDRAVPGYPLATPSRLTYPDKISLNDLKALENASDDFRFWLYIDGSLDIDLLVVQANDNTYYLKHDIKSEHRESGTLFLDYRNNPERMKGNEKYDIGSNNIVYGHNMMNGSMFGTLKLFQKKDYFFAHQYVYTYSTSGVTVWKIFSAYETNTDDYYIQTYFSSASDYLNFIRKAQKKSVLETDIILTARDDILTLSTCHRYNYQNGRFVVHAVKLGTAPIN